MPTYSYECKNCGSVVDIFHSMSAKMRVKCESCGGSTKRLIGSGAGLIFKGSGFYQTDYKQKDGANKSGGAPDDSAKGEVKTETKTESKSESKGESKSETKHESSSNSKGVGKSTKTETAL